MGVLEEGEGPWPGGVLVLVQGLGLVREGRVTKGRGDGERPFASDVQLVGFFLVVGSIKIHVLHPIRSARICVNLPTERLVKESVGYLA